MRFNTGISLEGLRKTRKPLIKMFRPRDRENKYIYWRNITRMTKATRMKCAGQVARMEGKRNACRVSLGKPEGNRPL
jgi:hypothetical protein